MSIWNYANPQLKDLVAYEPGKPIEEVARERGLNPEDIIKLASNENPLGPSPKAVAAMQAAVQDVHIYPDGASWKLRSALAVAAHVTFGRPGASQQPARRAQREQAPARVFEFFEELFRRGFANVFIVVTGLDQRAPVFQQGLGVGKAAVAVFGQLHHMGGALQQLDAQAALQRLQAAAHGGLAGAQLLGGGRQAAGLDDADKGLHQLNAVGAGLQGWQGAGHTSSV